MDKRSYLGISTVVLYDIFTALQSVIVAVLFQVDGEHPIVVLAYTLGLSVLLLWGLQYRNTKYLLNIMLNHPRQVILVSLYSAGAWIASFYALSIIEPATVEAICFGLGPVLAVIFWRYLRPNKPINRGEKIASVGVLISMAYMVYSLYWPNSSFDHLVSPKVLVGIIYCLIAAVCMVFTISKIKYLSERGITNNQIVLLRFPIAFSIVVFFGLDELSNKAISIEFLMNMASLSLVTIVAPVLLIQWAIQNIEPIKVSLLICLTPVFTLLMQSVSGHFYATFELIISIMLITSFTVYGTLSEGGRINDFQHSSDK